MVGVTYARCSPIPRSVNWQVFMSSSTRRLTGRGLTGAAVLITACAISIGALITESAFASIDDEHGAQEARDHHDRGEHGEYRHQGERHRYPVYAPEHIYYPRQESPGITLFVPLWDR